MNSCLVLIKLPLDSSNIDGGLLNNPNWFFSPSCFFFLVFLCFFFVTPLLSCLLCPYQFGYASIKIQDKQRFLLANNICWLIFEWENSFEKCCQTLPGENCVVLCLFYFICLRHEDRPECWAVMSSLSWSQLCNSGTVVLPATGPLGSPDHLSTPGTHTRTHACKSVKQT